jgi:hypothetical protein
VREPITIMVGHSAHQQCRAGQSSVQNTFVPGLPGTQAVWGTEPCMEPGIQAGPRRPECRLSFSCVDNIQTKAGALPVVPSPGPFIQPSMLWIAIMHRGRQACHTSDYTTGHTTTPHTSQQAHVTLLLCAGPCPGLGGQGGSGRRLQHAPR